MWGRANRTSRAGEVGRRLEQKNIGAIAHRRNIDEIDFAWANQVQSDLDRVLGEIAAGRPASLKTWQVEITPILPSDTVLQAPYSETLHAFRCRRLRDCLALAHDTIEKARSDYERKKQNYESKLRQAEWARQHAERERKRLEDAAEAEAIEHRLAGAIPLVGSQAGVVMGTRFIGQRKGEDLVVPVDKLTHMLVAGTTGFGKSVFLHQLLVQLLTAESIDKIVLVDLKGGVEFFRYGKHSKVQVAWEYAEVATAVADLVALMKERQVAIRESGKRWTGGRTLLVIDEYADVDDDTQDKTLRKRLLANLGELGRKGRSSGIVIVIAVQKATTDAMDSSLRNNLAGQICFKVGARRTAADMFGDLDDIAVDPLTLPRGRYIFRDAYGDTRYLQAHVAPGVLD